MKLEEPLESHGLLLAQRTGRVARLASAVLGRQGGGRGRAVAMEGPVPWPVLRASLEGRPPEGAWGTELELRGEMVDAQGVDRLSDATWLAGVTHLTVIGPLASPECLATLCGHMSVLDSLDLRSIGPAPETLPEGPPALRALSIGGPSGRWLPLMASHGWLSGLTHLETIRAHDLPRDAWVDVPLERLRCLRLDRTSAPSPAPFVGRIPSSLGELALREIELGRRWLDAIADCAELGALDLSHCRVAAGERSRLLAVARRPQRLTVAYSRFDGALLSEIVHGNGGLRALDVSGSAVDGACLSRAIARLLWLGAADLRLGADGFERIADAFEGHGLAHIDLARNDIGDDFGRVIAGASLVSVDLSSTRVGPGTAAVLLGGPGCPGLVSVGLDGCPLGRVGGPWHARPVLEALSASRTALEVDDPDAFFAPERMPSLRALDLGHNALGPGAASALARFLAAVPVRRLRLTESRSWSPTDWAGVLRATAPHVVSLVLGRDHSTSPAALDGLLGEGCPLLTELDLSEGDIERGSLDSLFEPSRLPNLARLSLAGEPDALSALAGHPLLAQLTDLQAIGDPGGLEGDAALGRHTTLSH